MQLSDSDIAAIKMKVGAPRASCGKLVLALEHVQAMREAGFSWSQIADYFGVSKSTVRRRLKGDPDRSLERVRTDTGKRMLAALAAKVVVAPTPQAPQFQVNETSTV